MDNPAAKILVDMSMVQDGKVGDGTTFVTVLGKFVFNYIKYYATKINKKLLNCKKYFF